MMLKTLAVASAVGLPLALAAPAAAAESATVQLAPPNDSGSSGTAQRVLDDAAGTLQVTINSDGLVPNLPHAQHVHIGGQNICPRPTAAGTTASSAPPRDSRSTAASRSL